MRWPFVARPCILSEFARGQLLAQLFDSLLQALKLLLLLVDQQVELFKQILGVADLDFQLVQALRSIVRSVHGADGTARLAEFVKLGLIVLPGNK